MKRVLLIADDNGVTSVVAALITNHVINAVAEQVGRFTFTFVAPLSAEQNERGH